MKSFRRRVQCLPPFPRKIMQLRAGFTGRCFVSGPLSSAKDTVNLKPVKLFFSLARDAVYNTKGFSHITPRPQDVYFECASDTTSTRARRTRRDLSRALIHLDIRGSFSIKTVSNKFYMYRSRAMITVREARRAAARRLHRD